MVLQACRPVKLISMETSTTPRTLPIIAGHLALDFANTVDDPDGPERSDHIATTGGLMQWAHRMGLVADQREQPRSSSHLPSGPDTERVDQLSPALRLRQVLNDVFGSLADAEPVSEPAWCRLQPFIADAIAAAALVPLQPGHGPYRYDWTHVDGLGAVIHPVAAAAGALLVSEDLRRLKRCGRCPWLFLDHSKNHSRRWCDMNDCGKAEKIERYLAKRAARRRGDAT